MGSYDKSRDRKEYKRQWDIQNREWNNEYHRYYMRLKRYQPIADDIEEETKEYVAMLKADEYDRQERKREYKRNWDNAHREHNTEYHRQWREKNQEHFKQYQYQYRENAKIERAEMRFFKQIFKGKF